jgi:hypothetical protein
MSPFSINPRVAGLLIALAGLALVGCKQDVGGRCEVGSDCSTGYCGGIVEGMVSAMGKVCTPPPVAAPLSDASPTTDAQDAAHEAASSDGASEAGPEAGAAETGDAASDAHETGADTGASAADGATDLTLEAGSGG